MILFRNICEVLWLGDAWVRLLVQSGLFMTAEEDEQRQVLGEMLLRNYVQMALIAENAGVHRWRCRPKLHLIHHVATERRASALNPAAASCWMDEDNIKRVMRIERAVHKRTATRSSLQRWLLGLPQKLRAFDG